MNTGPGSRRVLVVDDNEDGVESMSRLLEALGHEVGTARDGLEAVELAATFRPEVILMDLTLPRLSGYEAARRIRGLPEGGRIVMVAVTGWSQDEDRVQSTEAGFDHFWVKPVDVQALRSLLG